MELNTREEVTVLMECHKVEKISSIEHKIQQLSIVPLSSFIILMIYAIFEFWLGDKTWSTVSILLTAGLVSGVGYANVRRTNLLKQLFELKYEQ